MCLGVVVVVSDDLNNSGNVSNWELGRIFVREGKFDDAHRCFLAEVTLSDSANTLVYNDHGHLLNRLGRYDEAIAAISEVFPCYKGSEADIVLLSKASGTFYNSVWEPVQHCTGNYEFYLEEEKIARCIVLLTLLVTGLSLICIMVWVDSMYKYIPCIMVLVSFILLTGCLIQLSKLSSISKRISRSTRSEMMESYFSLGDVYRKVAHLFKHQATYES